MSKFEHVILVDEDDHPIGSEEKLVAHQQGLLHRAFSVFIFHQPLTGSKQLLLQQRHPHKYHCGGLWTNSCCSHPAPLESTIAAAQRRLTEEMNIAAALRVVGVFHYRAEFSNGLIEHEIDHVLVGEIENQQIVPNPAEVAAYRWETAEAIQRELATNPEHYTPWFAQALGIALADSN
jgi:isopentenyl-diphosphate delta-isomerase type 1